ncbi:hypothetical protein LCGC14_1979380 [marine sediment metagenome]|uniref:Uncharacterized protein n=1 Tax=marine sediment metagenome TaxID=412755 RepID=A0A0F9HMP8_9ZZZZ
MFGLISRWLGIFARKKEINFTPNPHYYPLDTNRHFYDFIADHSKMTDNELVDRVLSITHRKASKDSLLDCVRITRKVIKERR